MLKATQYRKMRQERNLMYHYIGLEGVCLGLQWRDQAVSQHLILLMSFLACGIVFHGVRVERKRRRLKESLKVAYLLGEHSEEH